MGSRSVTGQEMDGEPAPFRRWRLLVGGTVQGVGFRPFVYRLARRLALNGLVRNDAAGVVIEVEGASAALSAFVTALRAESPPAAKIDAVARQELAPAGTNGFVIRLSGAGGPPVAGVAPDLALCEECCREMFDPADRRYRYPFINCTSCGPRYTIIERIPYDRPRTSMRAFTMCPACRAEYDEPADRRFHAQPNACPDCGPRLWLHMAAGDRFEAGAAITTARRLLLAGRIVAIKGIGGFHLAVNAFDRQAVQTLRRRKGRPMKPLALMVRDLAAARRLVRLGAAGEAALTGPARPILLALKRPGHGLAEEVAPGAARFGVMLPYAPLHHLLLDAELPVLVMTSANRSDEPICIANDEAARRLAGLADAILLHDREIVRGNDDSVLMAIDDEPPAGEPAPRPAPLLLPLRRGRGYAPGRLPLTGPGPAVLGVGAELKNSICLAAGEQAVVSQHIGDLKNLETYRVFRRTIADLTALFAIQPQLVAHDLHPDYLSSRWAAEQGRPQLAVQHHHAHLAACLEENRHSGPAIGLILDGTGYGSDGTIWGGEILLGDTASCTRFGHLETMPLPGGDAAVAEPWRAGLAYLHRAFAGAVPELPFLEPPSSGIAPREADGFDFRHQQALVLTMLDRELNSPRTSSCGRLFDAVAAICGGRAKISYEAQAAIEFMQAGGGLAPPAFAHEITEKGDGIVLAVAPLVREIAAAVAAGTEMAEISRRFHYTLVELFTAAVRRAAAFSGLKTVALSGGVMQNELLADGLRRSLAAAGFSVLCHRQLPPNDGGIAFGQVAVARRHSIRG